MELYNYAQLLNPHWEHRNRIIASMIESNKTVIDLGCGAKNLLKFCEPARYLGVDGIPSADVVIDLNSNFTLPTGWDYVINSGILEFVIRPDLYLEKIKTLGDVYIFSWWRGSGWGRMQFCEIEALIASNYQIIETQKLGLVNRVYKCVRLQS